MLNTSAEDASSSSGPAYSLDQLLSKCQELLDCYDYDLAEKFVHRALELDPASVKIFWNIGFGGSMEIIKTTD